MEGVAVRRRAPPRVPWGEDVLLGRSCCALAPPSSQHPKLQADPQFSERPLFHEYYHGDTGAGRGGSHQTGWTALIAKLLSSGGPRP